jgi:hypothetical protein
MQTSNGFAKWVEFLGEVVCDFLFLALWLLMAWLVHGWLEKLFPIDGLPRYVGYLIEGLLDISTLLKLLKLRFKNG